MLVIAVLSTAGAPPCLADDWRFDDWYQNPLLFVHPLINYNYNPLWTQEWERLLVTSNGVRGTTGSATTNELLTHLEVNLTQPIGQGFRFLYQMNWFDGVHLDDTRFENLVGLEKSVVHQSGLQLMVNPESAKEEIDAVVGVLLANADRENYLRLWLRMDDFLYEEKNDRSGRSLQESVGPQWALRLASGRWQLFSRGHYSTPSKRTFDAPEASPDISAEERNDGNSLVRLRYRTGNWAFLEAEVGHHYFEEGVAFRDSTRNYQYQNRIARGKLLYYFPMGSNFRGRAELHYLSQRATAQGTRDYDYDRDEVPWAASLEWLIDRSIVEVSYLATSIEWHYETRDATPRDDYTGYESKLKLAWTYLFSPQARMLFSLSHQPEIERFGGFNVQVQVLF